MSEDLAADVARVLAALLDAKAWFRHGMSDNELAERTSLSLARVSSARREAARHGLVERKDAGTDHALTMLTPVGVAHARGTSQQVL